MRRALRPPARFAVALCLGSVLVAEAALGQTSESERLVLRLMATPIGALPPIALPMPASRDHNYWAFRLETGQRQRGGPDLLAVAGGVDVQFRGGSIFGVTAGYQERDCDVAGEQCGGHPFIGLRGRFNVLTGGPTLGALLGDYSATTTIGSELGVGYAHNVLPDMHACSIDLGMPLSLAMFQRMRFITYVTPAFALDVGCSGSGEATRGSFLTGMGFGVQQLGTRGLDLYVAFQKIFRRHTGYQVGISVSYTRLPSLARPRR